jgi:hypothetical protein
MVTDEIFFAWLDGELDPREAARVAAEVAADEELNARAVQHRAMQAHVKGTFDTLLDAQVPERLLEAARKPYSEVVDLGALRRSSETRRGSLPQWAAIAATLAIGIFVGTMVPQRGSAPVEVQGGKVYAAAALNDALDTKHASAPAGGIRIGLTFRDQAGEICRSFTQQGSSGLACRNGVRWRLQGLFATPEGQAGDYRMAGTDPNLAALVNSTISGEAFDATAEKTAKARGWR